MLWEGASDFEDVCLLTDCPCSSAWLHTHVHVGSADGHAGLGGEGGGGLGGDIGVEKMCWEESRESSNGKGVDMFKIHGTHIHILKE